MSSLSTFLRAKGAKTAVALAGAALALTGSLVSTGPSGADPKQFSAYVGTGSDTTQDIMNALAGEANGTLFEPVRGSGGTQVVSWDAVGTPCITPRAPGATFNRPNGSGNGQRALSRARDGGLWGDAACGGAKSVSGVVHYARSSSGPSGTGTALTFVPFGRDAISFAYYANGVTPVDTLTSQQLTTLFSVGPQTIEGVEIIPCAIQAGSGTYSTWLSNLNVTEAQADAATLDCGAAMQENDASALGTRGQQAQFAGKQIVIGFSAANFISQSNGVAKSDLFPGVDLGAIDDLGKPYEGTAPNTTPAAAFYGSSVYGRHVYNVVPTQVLSGFGNDDLKEIFVGIGGGEAVLCTEDVQDTVNQFGFLSVDDCGSTTTTGPLR